MADNKYNSDILVATQTIAEIIGYGDHDLTEEQIMKLAETFAEYFKYKDQQFNPVTFKAEVAYQLGLARYVLKKGDYEGLWFKGL